MAHHHQGPHGGGGNDPDRTHLGLPSVVGIWVVLYHSVREVVTEPVRYLRGVALFLPIMLIASFAAQALMPLLLVAAIIWFAMQKEDNK